MSERPTGGLFEWTDEDDVRLAANATGLLRVANRAGLITAADVHVAVRTGALVGEQDERVLLALALVTQAVRSGSTGLDLTQVARDDVDLDWPPPGDWVAAVRGSPLHGRGVLVFDHGLVHLNRYHEVEVAVAAEVRRRAAAPDLPVDEPELERGLGRLFAADAAEQRHAAEVAARRPLSIVTGGPGTGKTTTVARVLALLAQQAAAQGASPPRVALAAPTAKAAARLQQAVDEAAAQLPADDRAALGEVPPASTLHRLLGWQPGSRSRFKHNRGNRLPHDVVVVDEASMISLTMMSRVLEAVRDDARVLVLGDPDQLASVDAGAVLADLVTGLTGDAAAADDAASQENSASNTGGGSRSVARLDRVYRFSGAIGELARAVRAGAVETVLEVLERGEESVRFESDPQALRAELVRHALDLRRVALTGDGAAALDLLARRRLLVAHRSGPFGVSAWNRLIEQWVSQESGTTYWTPMYPGRPVLVTRNDYANGVFNGDTGVIVRREDGALRAWLDSAGDTRTDLPAARLGEVETVHAMTVHKAQGSQADEVVVVLPEADSPLLTRELFYTAVTRARTSLTVVGTPETVRAAIETRVHRATGLAARLSTPPDR